MLSRTTALAYLQQHDPALYLSLLAVQRMKSSQLVPFERDIYGFLNACGIPDVMALYCERSKRLAQLQQQFEECGRYPASRNDEVVPINRDMYHVALLLSVVTTILRFEILQQLNEFLHRDCGPPSRLLAVGVGTGYELKLARDALDGWEVDAFDTSAEAISFAADLLRFFGCPTTSLRQLTFPLETDTGLSPYECRFGKIVACELMEHLDDPERALTNLRRSLHPDGHMLVTMAINLAQEDHVYRYAAPDDARRHVAAAGLRIVRELLTPVVVWPFDESDRTLVFTKGNLICEVTHA